MTVGSSPDFGINVIGHVSGNLGLGVLARHVVDVLLARRCPVRVLDIDPKLGRGGHDRRFAEHTVGSVHELVYPVTCLIFPPDSIVGFLKNLQNRDLLLRDAGLNAALMNWEQMVVPDEWARVLEGLDAIVAPSVFTRETFEGALANVPVLSTRVPLRLPETVTANRKRFGLQPNKVWFGSGFEPQSDPARKNPFAVLDAFEQALPFRHDVGLVVKVNNATVNGRTHPVMEELKARSRRDGRMVLLEEPLDYESVLSLYASLDVYVSLHRSEGIGLGLMEAMSLGKPVIGTGWSGNMSFMDRSNSCVVAYELIPVRGSTYVYSEELLGPRAVWADPDVMNAAEWMRMLVERPDVRAAIGRNARESMERYQEEARRGLFVDELQSILESEVSWGIGEGRRKARRERLERSMAEGKSESTRLGGAWVRNARSLAKKAGFRRGKFPYWTPPRRGTS
jgi:glycosyltransferase involved in cell wall biosynthesis